MKRLIIIFSCLFLLSGCTVNYDITIKNDNTIIEKTSIKVSKNNKKDKLSSVKKDILSQYQIVLDKDNYKYKFDEIDDKVKVDISKKSDIRQLVSHSLYNELYEDYELFENDNKVYFKTVGNSYIGNLFVTKNYEDELSFTKNLEKLKINITFENEVIESNADEINKETNTYTWIFTKDDFEKGIKFTYKKNSIKKSKEKSKQINPIFSISIVFGLIIVGLIMLIIKNKNTNKV